MEYVKFNGNAIPEPNAFSMTITDNIVSEIKTMSGKTLADVNGWKYADVTLTWGYLQESYLQTLLSETRGIFTFTFKDIKDGEKTINAFMKSRVSTKTRFTDFSGNTMWKNIQITLSFPDSYS